MSAVEGMDLPTAGMDGVDLYLSERNGTTEAYATLLPVSDDDFSAVLKRAGLLVSELGAEVIRMHVLASIDSYRSFEEAANAELGDLQWPITYVDGQGCGANPIAGIQLHAVAGTNVQTVNVGGRPVGRQFEDEFAAYCYLGDLVSTNNALPLTVQGRESFDLIERGLNEAGMELKDLVRTWLFIDRILDWYGDFNLMRDEFFNEKGMFDRFLPASTGIGGANSHGSSVAACAVAIKPKNDQMRVQEVKSPLQCPAFDYGSSFCRAAEIATPEYRSILVSGTASIAPEGETVHVGDTNAQIDLTLRVVREILKSRETDFCDTVRANAYFKHQADAADFDQFMNQVGLPAGRVIISHDDVCRDDLLFEIELDAITSVT